MKVLVCGGRDFGNILPKTREDFEERQKEYYFIIGTLEQFAIDNSELFNPNDNWLPTDIEIISGMAKGADSVAVDWAVVNWCNCYSFPADWKTHGKKAGTIRNQQMLDEGKPDVVIAFPGGRGTAHMVKIAKEAGIKVIEIAY